MGTKTIDIIVLEDGQAKQTQLAKFTLDELPYKSTVKEFLSEEEFCKSGINCGTDTGKALQKILQLYLEPLVKVQKLFEDIVKGTPQEDKASYEKIAAVSFAFTSVDAYNQIKPVFQKEKDYDAETNSVAHFNDWGIFVSFCEEPGYIAGTVAHEHGHYMHHTLHPEKYQKSDPTLKELAAIFVQEKCGYAKDYVKNTAHHRARQLL